MPIRGERVGEAYVRIFADGSAIPDGIREGLDDAEPEVRTAARKQGQAYDEEFAKTFRANNKKMERELSKHLTIGEARTNAIAETFSDGLLDGLRTTLRKRVSGTSGDTSIADMIANNLIGDFRRTGNYDNLLTGLENLPAQIDRATKQVQAIEEQYARDHAAAIKENNARDLQAQRDMLNEAYFLHAQFNQKRKFADDKAAKEHLDMLNEAYFADRQFELKRQRMVRDAYRENAEFDKKRREALRLLRTEYANLLETVERMERGERGGASSRRRLFNDLARLRAVVGKVGGDDTLSREFDRIENRARNLHPTLRRTNRLFDETADLLGKATGKGSRNNFLNFLGSMTRGLAKVLFILPKFVTKVGADMGSAFTKAGGGLGGLLASVGTLVPLLGSLALGFVGVAVAVGVLFIAMSPLVSLLSLLLGLFTSLVATISFALVAAVGSLVAVLGPAVFGVGVLILGLTHLSDKMQKTISQDIRPLRNAFSDLGDVAARALVKDVGDNAETLAPVLRRLEPLVRGIATALSDIATDWVDRLDSPGFDRFVSRIEKFLPDALRTLGRVAANTLGGIGGLFTGMIPFMRRVLGWLEDITEQFSDWANSKEGQKDIKQFFEDAGDSAEALGGFLGDVWEFLSLILSKGRKTGDSIFTSMGDSIERATKFLKDNPDALSDWFEDAEEFAHNVGHLVEEVTRLLDKLDSPQGRKAVNDFTEAIADLGAAAEGTANALGKFPSIRDKLKPINDFSPDDVFNGVVDFFAPGGTFNRWINSFGDQLEKAGRTIQRWWGNIDFPDIKLPSMSGIGAKITKQIGPINIRDLVTLPNLSFLLSPFTGLASKILGRIGDIDLMKNFDFPSLSEIASHFAAVASSILGRIGDIDLLKAFDFPSLSEIASHFIGLGAMIVDAIGDINIVPNINMPDIPDIGIDVPFVGGSGRVAAPNGATDPATPPLNTGLPSPYPSITIITPTKDPYAVALETVNALAARIN